ncbi:permease [Sedimentibacter hydroxybenzoicus DSM 7310]|uniref:Permease n=1 Tax=Sedimentibacter hydroxybenzoicus DSM 7310 TaxID=1123245 RepID=A0A974GWM9_SEDHY|nr:permease [Sedimentibacter hydroxybenzoicus]NYB74664.1 permease [Sedimentibacter hydroxybenzoicus DSM 7310]
MEKLVAVIKRYKVFILLSVVNVFIVILYPETGMKSIEITKSSTLEMLSILPPIFILLGLLDVWVKKETMMKYMGEKSGFIGVLIAFLLGSAAAGPLYAAFPVAMVLLKKGSKLSYVLIMIGAWSTTKIPLLLFEASSMGIKFTALRFALNLIGIGAIAYTTEKLLSKDDKDKIYKGASLME